MTLEEKVNQLLTPWPSQNFTQDIFALYNATSFGSAYQYCVNDPDRQLNHLQGLNKFQELFLNSSRLQIPIVLIGEVLHSSTSNGTVFPNPTLLGATWNPSLVQNIGDVIGREARAAGITRGFGPVLQVATDPRFGRFEESYGEDPLLVGTMGVSMITGLQGGQGGGPSTYLPDAQHVSVEAKHAVAYAESGRDGYAIHIDTPRLWNLYLRPWYMAIRAGLRGLMVSHPEVNGMPAHANADLLQGILRGKLGGTEMLFGSDAGDIDRVSAYGVSATPVESAMLSVIAGLDQELSSTLVFPYLAEAVRNGSIPQAYVDRAVSNVLREKIALGLLDGPSYWRVNDTYAAQILDAPAHRALAYTAAVEGTILLMNQNSTLPLGSRLGNAITRVAVLGPLAGCGPNITECDTSSAYMGGYSNAGARIYTLLDAVSSAAAQPGSGFSFVWAPGANITDSTDNSGIPAAVAAAQASDIAIVVVGDTAAGYSKGTCSEGKDAEDIDLPGTQLDLLYALATQAPHVPVVVILVHGRPATFGAGPHSKYGPNNALTQSFSALLAGWRPGEEGGNALWDLLTGVANPSGHLTQNWVRHVGATRSPVNPYLQARGNPSTPWVSETVTPLFYFGQGLSYSAFTVVPGSTKLVPSTGSPLPASASFNITGRITGGGPTGKALLQVYFSQNAPTKAVRYAEQLLCWSKVLVPSDAGAQGVPFTVGCAVQDTMAYDADEDNYVVYAGTYSMWLAWDTTPTGRIAGADWTISVGGEGTTGQPWSFRDTLARARRHSEL